MLLLTRLTGSRARAAAGGANHKPADAMISLVIALMQETSAERVVETGRFELEPFCGRERSGSPQAKSPSRAAGEGSLWKRQFEVEIRRDGQI